MSEKEIEILLLSLYYKSNLTFDEFYFLIKLINERIYYLNANQ